MSDPTKRLCREVECAGGQRAPTGRTEALTNDELADRNRALVASTIRWSAVPASETVDGPIDREAIMALEDACTVGAGAMTKYTREMSEQRGVEGAVLRAFIARAVQLADLPHPEALVNHVREHGLAALEGDAAGRVLTNAFGKLDAEAAALRAALHWAHDAMQTWFSSEYLNHPQTRAVGAALAGDAGRDLLAEHRYMRHDTNCPSCIVCTCGLTTALAKP